MEWTSTTPGWVGTWARAVLMASVLIPRTSPNPTAPRPGFRNGILCGRILSRSVKPHGMANVIQNLPHPKHRLDATERRMVELLQRDGRLTVTELARTLGVSEVTARRKL